MRHETEYLQVGDEYVAYQVVGEGPTTTLWSLGFAQGLDIIWDHPLMDNFLATIASWSRLVLVQSRGTGASTPAPHGDIFTECAGDLEAVLQSVGASHVVVLGSGDSGLFATHLAATRPPLVSGLALINSYARFRRAEDYPVGVPGGVVDRLVEGAVAGWGRGDQVALTAVSMAHDPEYKAWFAKSERAASSPDVQRRRYQNVVDADLRPLLGAITASTVVIHRRDNPYIRVGHGRYLAEHITGAKYVELDGADHAPWLGETRPILEEIEEIVTGVRGAVPLRRFAVILFSDIVDSTGRAAAMGDDAWRAMLDAHDSTVRTTVTAYGGRVVKTTGDGFVALFESPTRAARCAASIRGALGGSGLSVRMGMHAAEIEHRGDDVGGMGVHIAARVSEGAAPGEILATRTIKDLVVGSGLRFSARGTHSLKGVSEPWELLALEGV